MGSGTMDKLGLLFDPKEFAVAFGAVTGDLRSAATEARPDATVWLERGAAVAGAGFAWGHGQIVYKRQRLAAARPPISAMNVVWL